MNVFDRTVNGTDNELKLTEVYVIKNIILDVGRVLVQWDPVHAMRELGFSTEATDAINTKVVESGLWDLEDEGKLSDTEIIARFVDAVPGYEKEIHTLWDNIEKAIWQFDDSCDWIRRLKQDGYRVYILSNYGAHTYEKTKDDALSFLELVDGITFSYRVKLVKPNKEIYLKLLQMHGLKSEECVFIDDRTENIAAAESCGIRGIVYRNRAQADSELERICTEKN